jgi:hypothetical protein
MGFEHFRVIEWMALSSAIHARDGWIAWAGDVSPVSDSPCRIEPPPTPLPPILRRRVTPVGQLALRAAQCLERPVDGPRVILCSRHGEFSRTLGLIEAVVAGEATSPAEFTLSVHHALAGLLSIAQRNMAGHTAIAAGPDTFGCGMLEALSCLAAQPEHAVLLIYYDEALPGFYAELEDSSREAEFALALLLSSAACEGDLTLTTTPATASAGVAAAQQAKDFLSFLLTGRVELLSPGERMNWHWRRAA